MNRDKFIRVIRLLSKYKIKRKLGNYILPNAGQTRLSDYVNDLIRDTLERLCMAIGMDGNVYPVKDGLLNAPSGENQKIPEQKELIEKLTKSVLYHCIENKERKL